ncbi:hypothetical protein [Vibrio gallaecicus]|nr:hypothetical protein [Vibrio gallaecicus]MDN3613183.1 hypothetical protein [Vibrio gallaecicus]
MNAINSILITFSQQDTNKLSLDRKKPRNVRGLKTSHYNPKQFNQ